MPPICYVNVIHIISVRQSDDARRLLTQHTSSISGSLSIRVFQPPPVFYSVTEAGLSEEHSQPQAATSVQYNVSQHAHRARTLEEVVQYRAG